MQGSNAYVTVASLNKVLVINADPKNPEARGQIDVGDRPNGIWANPEGT
jgi:DNA-binding beta-propeller fold protein YncE